MTTERLPWDELFGLHVIKRTAQVFAQRWNMGLGYMDLGSSPDMRAECPPHGTGGAPVKDLLCDVIQRVGPGQHQCVAQLDATRELLVARARARQPRTGAFSITCHAGTCELVAPVVVERQLRGALLVGPFAHPASSSAPHPSERTSSEGTSGMARQHLERLDQCARSLSLDAASYHRACNKIPLFDEREQDFAGTLLEAAADEITAFMSQQRASRSSVGADTGARKKRKKPRVSVSVDERMAQQGIIGRSTPMRELYSILDRVARSDATVLIQGENGTGKELVARAIHYGSDRAGRRFVITNCSAFNDNLLDSELFGHKKGAFTGAFADKPGLFETVDKGTFFLDEIGDMSPSLQVKILRVLQEGTFIPVGDTETRQVDVRIIAATNRDLRAMVAAGQFREDLYYRINVINLVIPPLRERREDIELLAGHFLHKYAARTQRGPKTLSRDCLYSLGHYDWPGNVRELSNEIERMIVLAGDDPEIGEELLSPRIKGHIPVLDLEGDEAEGTSGQERNYSLPLALRTLERRIILASLERNEWNKTRAAAELDISRRNLIRLVKKYELES